MPGGLSSTYRRLETLIRHPQAWKRRDKKGMRSTPNAKTKTQIVFPSVPVESQLFLD